MKHLYVTFTGFVFIITLVITLAPKPETVEQRSSVTPLIAFFTAHPYESAAMVPDIVILNPVTREERVFSLEPGWTEADYMAWSPDYRKLLISYIDYSDGFSGRFSVTAFDIASGETEALVTEVYNENISGSYSPSGTDLYFLRRTIDPAGPLTSVLHTLSLGNRTDSVQRTYLPELYMSDAVWSLGGGQLAASGYYVEQKQQERLGNEIFLVDATRNAIVNMTKSPFQEYVADWSPDGSAFAYVSDATGKQELYVMDAKGRHKRRLTETQGELEVDYAKWLPDGNRLIYLTRRNSQNQGTGQLILYDFDSTQEKLLVEQWWLTDFDISPDGNQLAYISYDIFSGAGPVLCVLEINTRDQWCAAKAPFPGGTLAWGID